MIKAQNDKGARRTSWLSSEETSQTGGAKGDLSVLGEEEGEGDRKGRGRRQEGNGEGKGRGRGRGKGKGGLGVSSCSPGFLQTLRNTTPSSFWVLMGAASPRERNNGQHEKLSSKANRWLYSQQNWVRLYNSWANLRCHLSPLKITSSSRVYRARSQARQLFLVNSYGHQRRSKQKHRCAPVSLRSCSDNIWLLALLSRRRPRAVSIPCRAAPVLWSENKAGWFSREEKQTNKPEKAV